MAEDDLRRGFEWAVAQPWVDEKTKSLISEGLKSLAAPRADLVSRPALHRLSVCCGTLSVPAPDADDVGLSGEQVRQCMALAEIRTSGTDFVERVRALDVSNELTVDGIAPPNLSVASSAAEWDGTLVFQAWGEEFDPDSGPPLVTGSLVLQQEIGRVAIRARLVGKDKEPLPF